MEISTALDQLRLELLRAPAEVRAAPANADRQKYSRLFELCMAVELGLIPWASLPPAAFEAAQARTKAEFLRYKTNGAVADYGVDAASADMLRVAQAKWYGKTSSITWEHVSTFFTSAGSCGASERTLVTSQDARTPRRVEGLMRGLPIQRVTLDDAKINAICTSALAERPMAEAPPAVELTDAEFDSILNELLGGESPAADENPPADDAPSAEAELERLIESPEVVATAPLHRWQAEAIPLLLESLAAVEDPSKAVHACITCGAGKTRLVIELIVRGEHTPCVVLVPSRSLLEQFRAEVARWAPHLSVGLVGDALCELGRDITVATYNSAAKLTERHFDLLVVDEAHHMEAEFETASEDDSVDSEATVPHRVFATTARSLDFQRALLVSATLDRDEAACDFTYLIDQAVADEVVVDYHIVIPMFSEGDRLEALRRMIIEHPEWARILAYCNTVAAAAEFARVCVAGGVPAATFDAKTPTRVRRSILDDLSAGRIRVLATVNTLGEGVDVRETDACMFVEPRNSRINVMQCIGRVQRRCRETGKTVAAVILPAADEERELARFLRTLGANDPRLVSGASAGRVSVVATASDTGDLETAEKLSESVYDRAGFFLRGEDPDWWARLELLRAYVVEHEKLPSTKTIYRDFSLGSWVAAQRTAHRIRKRLSAEQVAALEAFDGWSWGENAKKPDEAWNDHLVAVRAYIEEFGLLPKNRIWYRDMALGAWVISVQNSRRGTGSYKLTEERIASLDAIQGWSWGGATRARTIRDWQSSLETLREFVEEHKRLPAVKEIFNDFAIGIWASKQRKAKRGKSTNKMTPEREKALNAIPGWVWGEEQETAWQSNLETLREFVAEHKRLPTGKETFNGSAIGKWADNQRQSKYGRITYKMTPEREKALNEIPGWHW